MTSKRRTLIVMATFAGLVLGSLILGVQTSVSALDELGRKMQQAELLLEVMQIIEEQYVDADSTGPEPLMDAAIQGMVSGLDDHSVFFTPQLAKEFNEQTQGEFQGLGISIQKVDGWLTVMQVLEGTPAEEAGLLAEDRIVFVEDDSTRKMNVFEAMTKLKGLAGTSVNLRIARRGESKFLEVTVTRGVIKPLAINSSMMLDRRTGYIRLQDFTKDAADELGQNIDDLLAQDMDALVLDLRDNFGGLLDVAVDVCDHFIDRGKRIVTYRGRGGEEREYSAKHAAKGGFLLAVLVNEYSASASEIVAGCIQDWGRGIIVGAADTVKNGKTYGKGSVQTLFPLGSVEGAQLKLTTAKYYTPLDRAIQDIGGVTPDVLVPISPETHASIRTRGRYGVLPPNAVSEDQRLLTADSAVEDEAGEQDDSEVTATQIFDHLDQAPDVKDELLYDSELLSAYQHLNSARVFTRAAKGATTFAGAGG